ncbi:MAG: response regulator transcription factor [Spartobacteria bacterium]|nr:response regulator transcription factor [Spartobacteria bacterium]
MHLRLAVADDHELMREGLISLINNEHGMEVVGHAGSGRDIVDLAAREKPDVVIMDVAMPDMNGMEATRQIVARNPDIKVVALSGHDNQDYIHEMLKAGAVGYVLKKRAYEELLKAVRHVLNDRIYLSPDVAEGVLQNYFPSAPSISKKPAFVKLTDREREVLQLIAEGHTTKDMADSLRISVKTVETHRRNMKEKLNVASIAELTKYAVREGLTDLDF